MTRKHTRRRMIVPLPPRGLRPRLDHGQLVDLGLAHLANLDAIATGRATLEVLWQTAGGVFTWSRVAELLHLGEPEMTTQLHVIEHVILRYQRTGRVGFTGPEYQLAKLGVDVMDELARIVDRPTAVAAAEWSERRIERIAAQCVRRETATEQLA